ALPLAVWFFFFSSRRRHTRSKRDWSSDVCSSDLRPTRIGGGAADHEGESEVDLERRALLFLEQFQPAGLGGQILLEAAQFGDVEIGRASCRERGWGGGGGVAIQCGHSSRRCVQRT